jgi:hypothetical protein
LTVRTHRFPVEKASAGGPRRFNAWILGLGLLAASVLSLVGGAFLAVSFEGLARVLFAALGFTGYLFCFSRAFRDLLPGVLSEGDPDPERARARETSPPPSRKAYLTAA